MSQSEAAVLKTEVEQLGRENKQVSQWLEEEGHVDRIQEQIRFAFMRANEDRMRDETPENIERSLRAAARRIYDNQRDARNSKKLVDTIARDPRIFLNQLWATALGMIFFSVGWTLGVKLLENADPRPGELVDLNPFSDIGSTAEPRPSRRRGHLSAVS